MNPLYALDLYAWTSTQAMLLKEGRYSDLDVIHLIEELESLGESLVSQLESRLIVLLAHLLKLQYATPYSRERAGRGWRLTCRAQRQRLARLLTDSPSLQRQWDKACASAYATACLDAALALDLPEDAFHPTCPWDQATLLSEGST